MEGGQKVDAFTGGNRPCQRVFLVGRPEPACVAQSTLPLVRCDQGSTAFLAMVCFVKIPGSHEFDFPLVVSTLKNKVCGAPAESKHV